MFNKRTAISTLLVMAVLFLASLILKVVLIRKIVLIIILIAVAIAAIIWTGFVIGIDDYTVIQRIIKFFLRGIVTISYIGGLILLIPILWKW